MAPKQKRSQQDDLTSVKKPKTRSINYSLCIPTSIINRSNAKNLQQVTNILYQIAKVASIYNVGEIIIMDIQTPPDEKVNLNDVQDPNSKKKIKFDDDNTSTEKAKNEVSEDAMTIATILQYFVTPPYLTKTLFKKKFFSNFQYAKNFPKLTTLPFMNPEVSSKYREGLTVTMGKTTKSQNKSKKSQPLKNTKFVNIGYDKYLELQGQQVPVNVRVTVNTETKKVVSPIEAYEEQVGAKSSYGYHVRIAKKFTSIFTESSYPDGYSQSIYINSGDYFIKPNKKPELAEVKLNDSQDLNLLLIISKWNDIELAFKYDSKNLSGVENPKEFFDGQITIPEGTRIEDGSLIALTKLSTL
ncbi:hypothetical protein BN7_5744 [Wickerhamomyces ciferrii]|uniref:Uncharacterized protein n=1 Tax=Wickerhamomyces ciferrii (strain ATCC 14091 / BCRC 22168 / CBS 111 / JCM 3599 / NBRC 0793 / NRRL Y-1031 F-60-10) TaxID=1206466 RepID=K0KSL9_WICCF|nr:uncharacterized protein BN7_5744 [Wickerhamomyces ciferrii]CCH46156.1 hypothetical protein BN7_5744 [Wickerhamomyces ciferrii]